MIKRAFVFPGQGSQSQGMLTELAKQYPIVTDTFHAVSEAVGYDVWDLVQHGSPEQLNQTKHTQVIMLAADVAVYNVLDHLGIGQADFMAGHSLGEYPALVCADSLALFDAAKLVSKRAELMQETVPLGQGAMAAIVGITDDEVKEICKNASHEGQEVTPANYNAIGQVVIAGHTMAVEKAIALAEKNGARLAKLLPVSVPCHCPLLQKAADAFEEILAAVAFNTPRIPVISNVDLSIYKTSDHIRRLLKKQLVSPVKWVETVQFFKTKQVGLIIECGPGKVLTGLVKRIDRSITSIGVFDQESLNESLTLMDENSKSGVHE